MSGHFGPGIVRFVLMQHVQGQVTVERLLAQLKGLGVRGLGQFRRPLAITAV